MRRRGLSDARASAVIDAVLTLAVTVRDEVGPSVSERARDVLAAAGGDPIAALTVAAALVRVDQPVDAWWRRPSPLPAVDVEALVALDEQEARTLAPHGTHAAFNRHRGRGETPCEACVLAERLFQRRRYRRRFAASGRAAAS